MKNTFSDAWKQAFAKLKNLEQNQNEDINGRTLTLGAGLIVTEPGINTYTLLNKQACGINDYILVSRGQFAPLPHHSLHGAPPHSWILRGGECTPRRNFVPPLQNYAPP